MKQLLATVLLAVAFSAFGHGGEDHGAPPPALSQSVAPRASAATDDFEVVAAVEDQKLVIYVDRFASNEPVAAARVEVEGDVAGIQGVASETSPGTYVIDLAAGLPAARHPLTISIETSDSADLLSLVLDTSQPAAAATHSHDWSEWAVWLLAAVLLLAGAALLVLRRRRQRR
ncbi:MAG: LPXTG cell wall anchor domain-containing protein [Rhodobacteraceae bacterium]|uniref:LPXTG cell wall anchor domain-containing protein n=1 Tax=Accumulibacter sp. TaxID=2053492 RepID=UPI0019F4ED8B|nr:LPXTG cell wall anchor domain-containing protein [Accumulibacter sp.]MBE2260445.1 LPXTG cell wall anchor domain-containing protein [Paracoccaceae bacterium]MCB1940896.1 LPXTG cell wall anchor domain-containing protein [Accumulibacter sp.]